MSPHQSPPEGRWAAAASMSGAEVDALCQGWHDNPFAILGPHFVADGWVIRCLMPTARRVDVLAPDQSVLAEMLPIGSLGLFQGGFDHELPGLGYRLRVEWGNGTVTLCDDPYRFPPILGEMDTYLLAEGSHLESWRRLGATLLVLQGVAGTGFAVWAPNARRVSVVGEFCQWDGRRLQMRRRHDAGVFELFVPGVGPGAAYKYELLARDGHLLPLKADPMARAAEPPPATASIVPSASSPVWTDEAWMQQRANRDHRRCPISIYEVHLPSWRRQPGGGYLSYRELAHQLIPYVRELGFTHLELLPISEYPFDGSWGYQPTGLFAPTSRLGSAEDFRYLVDQAHAAGLGVVLDWVAGHFPADAHGMAQFDGTSLYEHIDPQKGYHQDWNTLIYNYGRNEVANFLLCNAMYWLEEFHIDGLRVDAVASMLYLDYSRKPGEWVPNQQGGNENWESVEFLQRVNATISARHPGVITIAEESTAWPGVSRSVDRGGLGFGFKWNMGWMHDTLGYMARDPIHRRWHHHDMTFASSYVFSENFMLPLSHDEVVHGKGSLLSKMSGDYWQKFANLRCMLGFMWTHPGKKLLFMGGEFAQWREWNHDDSLDWWHLDDFMHAGVRILVGDLNRLYCNHQALYWHDCEPDGFEWLEADAVETSVFAYLRRGTTEREVMIAVVNCTPVPRLNFRIGVPFAGGYIECLNTDGAAYGGSNMGNAGYIDALALPHNGQPFCLELTLPPLAMVILQPAQGG